MAASRTHERRRFSGRDPDEAHRASTPLELLYDLTIVVAFGTAADELAHFLAEGHVGAGIGGFVFASFAVSWAWLNYSWFASAYDTDDWVFRLATMVQMVGVIVLALGLPQLFESIDHGGTLDNGVMVAGLRGHARRARRSCGGRCRATTRCAAGGARVHGDDRRRAGRLGARWPCSTCRSGRRSSRSCVLIALEVTGPCVAERKAPTPWHAEHIAERYGLLVIITLGEVILGTVAALERPRPRRGRLDASTRRCWLSPASGWRSAAGGCTSPCRGPSRWSATAARAFPFGYGHLLIFAAAGGDGRGPARRRVRPRGRGGDRRVGDRAQRRDPGRDLRRGVLRSVLAR